ncbi:unnamed protein product [Urochloa humidicola]
MQLEGKPPRSPPPTEVPTTEAPPASADLLAASAKLAAKLQPEGSRRGNPVLRFRMVGRPIRGEAGFPSLRALIWRPSGEDLSSPSLSAGEAFRDYALRNFHASVFQQVHSLSPLLRPTALWVSPNPRLPSCNATWMKNTLNFWLDGATPTILLTEVAPFIFRTEISRPSIALFILTLGDLRHGRYRVRFFPDEASAMASIPSSVSPTVLWAGPARTPSVGRPSVSGPPTGLSPTSVGPETAHSGAPSPCGSCRASGAVPEGAAPAGNPACPIGDASPAVYGPAAPCARCMDQSLPSGFPRTPPLSAGPCAKCAGILSLPAAGDFPPLSPQPASPAQPRQETPPRPSFAAVAASPAKPPPISPQPRRLPLPSNHRRCFRCLALDHRRAACRDPVRCRRCWLLGHTERHCSTQPHPLAMPGLPFDGASSPPLSAPRSAATSSAASGSASPSPPPGMAIPAPADLVGPDGLEEGEIPPDDEPDSEGDPSEDLLDEDDLGPPQRPDSVDVYMPPVNMAHLTRLAYAIIDPPQPSPGWAIRDALVTVGEDPRIRMVPSSYDAMLLVFGSTVAREAAIDAAPFLLREYSIELEHHDETANRFHFDHQALVSVAIKDFPMEHWNRERIIFTAGPYANPHRVDPLCVTGVDFFAVLMQVKAEGAHDIPLEEFIKNHSGLGTFQRIDIINIDDLEESDSDSDGGGSGPPSPGPDNPNLVAPHGLDGGPNPAGA